MPYYKVTTVCKCYTEYLVKASSKKKAEEKFWDSETLSEEEFEWADEEIIEIKKADK